MSDTSSIGIISTTNPQTEAVVGNTLLRHSLKARVTLFTLAIFVTSLWGLAYYASQMLREDMERLLGLEQFSTVTLISANINEELTDRMRALEGVAAQLDERVLNSPGQLQDILEHRPVLNLLFNGGHFITDATGTTVASVPVEASRIGINYMFRMHIANSLKNGTSSISSVTIGKALQVPVFSIAVPIRNRHGDVIGSLIGVINLTADNFLDRITANPYALTGGYVLVSRQQRLIVTATDKSRIMEALPPVGVNPKIDRFLSGREGTDILRNPKGVEVMVSVKAVPVADWYVAGLLPTDEAFAPIADLQRRMALATILLTVIVGALTWWLLRQQLMPLQIAATTLHERSGDSQLPTALPNTTQDEIGQLIGGFNHLLATLRQRESLLRQSEARLDLATEASGIGIWDMNLETGETYHSRLMSAMLGYEEGELNATWDAWAKIVHPDDVASVKMQIDNLAKTPDKPYAATFRIKAKNGSEHWIESRGRVIEHREGKVIRMAGTHLDITERKRAEAELQAAHEQLWASEQQQRALAQHDMLTGLANRLLFSDRLSQALVIAQRERTRFALLYVDLDKFKPVNDAFGHAVGDLLLKEAGHRMVQRVRESDTVARVGGDEFVILLRAIDSDQDATTVADSIRDSLRQTFFIESHLLAISCSIGIAIYPDHGGSEAELSRQADVAMYRAKKAGRDVSCLADRTAAI